MEADNLKIPLLVARGVSKTYRLGSTDVKALERVSLTVAEGEFFAIAGSSGSGKTTLLNLLGGIDTPTEGEIFLDQIPLKMLSGDELARFRSKKIGFVFQTFNLIPTLTAIENVEYPLVLLGESKTARRERARAALEAVGLGAKTKHRPGELSGGQRQRVAIARAMVKQPKIILADEPTANLDGTTAVEILDLMQKLNADHKVTFVFSTHDARILERASRVFHVAEEIAAAAARASGRLKVAA